ncbi:MAG: mannose-6-phosphate isomerase, class I [Actinomyces sp.]|nr:mannose-6-phosphate isomerase, class I [Actinomyces sp.]
MERLTGWKKNDAWGSTDAIPNFLGTERSESPVSEVWFGDHIDGPTSLNESGIILRDLIDQDPTAMLGDGLLYSFGPRLPFLMKLIAPAEALSLQVHPTKELAREGYIREDVLGIERTAADRTYRDMNHKPEMIYALTDFEALVGFRVPRKARRLLDGLEGMVADSLRKRLRLATVRSGLKMLIGWLFDEDSPATAEGVSEFAASCAQRLERGTSPSRRTDEMVTRLAAKYVGDPGIIVAFLMNPVSLRPGEAVYIPPRQIHSYQSGLGIEVMASSDNVVRAGLTRKYVDSAQLVEIAEFSALPPIRVAAEHPSDTTDTFLAPAQEFSLSVTTLPAAEARSAYSHESDARGAFKSEVSAHGAVSHESDVHDQSDDPRVVTIPGEGPRILMCLEGSIDVTTSAPRAHSADHLTLTCGQSVFVGACEHDIRASGRGKLIQCATP